MDTPWKRARERQYQRQEKRLAEGPGGRAQINSGRTWFSKRDVIKFDFLVEARTTEADSYSVKAKELKKLTKDGFFHQQLPAMNIEFERHNENWFLIREVDFEGMCQRLLELEALLEKER